MTSKTITNDVRLDVEGPGSSVDKVRDAIIISLEQLRLSKHSGKQVITLQWSDGGVTGNYIDVGRKLV